MQAGRWGGSEGGREGREGGMHVCMYTYARILACHHLYTA